MQMDEVKEELTMIPRRYPQCSEHVYKIFDPILNIIQKYGMQIFVILFSNTFSLKFYAI